MYYIDTRQGHHYDGASYGNLHKIEQEYLFHVAREKYNIALSIFHWPFKRCVIRGLYPLDIVSLMWPTTKSG